MAVKQKKTGGPPKPSKVEINRRVRFGKEIKQKLVEYDINQVQLAEDLGINHRFLNQIIKGKRPGWAYREIIARRLDIDISKYTA